MRLVQTFCFVVLISSLISAQSGTSNTSDNSKLNSELEKLMDATHTRRLLVQLPPPWMRALLVMLDASIPNFNVSTYWLDYVAVNRTCPVDNMPRIFGLMPARFGYRLDYLAHKPWYSDLTERIQKTLHIPR